MEWFFCPQLNEHSTVVSLSGEESRHAQQVFRKSTGEKLTLTNGEGLVATAEIRGGVEQLECTIRQMTRLSPPPSHFFHLAIATIRPKRMDWAVEKCSELGIGSITPIFTRFTSIKSFKRSHLQKITVSAMKQSKQAYLPVLHSPLPFNDWLTQLGAQGSPQRLVAHLSESAVSVKHLQLLPGQPLHMAVGPEGGFSDVEVRQAEQMGFRQIKITGQVLRTETAAVAVLAQVMLKFL